MTVNAFVPHQVSDLLLIQAIFCLHGFEVTSASVCADNWKTVMGKKVTLTDSLTGNSAGSFFFHKLIQKSES